MNNRYPLEKYPDVRADIIQGLAYTLDPRAGTRNYWSSASYYEMARGPFTSKLARNPDSMRRDENFVVFARNERDAPIFSNTVPATAGDFPGIAGAAILLTASKLYDLAPRTLRNIAARRDRPTFHPGYATRLTRPALAELVEGAQIPTAPLFERKEQARLRTFAWMISIGRMLLLGDAHNQVQDAVRAAVDAALYVEDDLLFELLSANSFAGVTMADGVSLFNAAHGNTSTGVIAAASLAVGFELLLDQKDANGVHFLATEPRYLIAGPKNVVTAKTELQKLAFDNNIEVIAEPRLGDSLNWYLAADPNACAALEYGSLQPSPSPRVQLASAFHIDGLQFKIVHDCAAWAVDWRPIWRSTGV